MSFDIINTFNIIHNYTTITRLTIVLNCWFLNLPETIPSLENRSADTIVNFTYNYK